MPSSVVVEKLEPGFNNLVLQFLNSFKQIGLGKVFNNAHAILIKPNLTYPYYKEGVTTRVEFIRALVRALRSLNDKTIIYIGEGEGGYNSFSMSQAFIQMGFDKIEQDFNRVKLLNLSHMPITQIYLETLKGQHKIELPEVFFKEIDFSISCPVPKVHCMTRTSLSYKNIWGCVPDIMRLKNHYMFDYIISKISEQLKFQFAFLDGKYGLDNNGPMVGTSVETNWFVASNSLGAFDMVVSEMMGVNWKRVRHLKMASDYGLLPDRNRVQIIGDIKTFNRKFTLKRNFWNYPALFAFNSRHLTHLFYFSRWAKLLHDIMYIFRKRPIYN